jgi:hypothetical protein
MTANRIPDHVPAELVKRFDIVGDPAMQTTDPFAATTTLHDRPRIFWNPDDPYFGGAWVPISLFQDERIN